MLLGIGKLGLTTKLKMSRSFPCVATAGFSAFCLLTLRAMPRFLASLWEQHPCLAFNLTMGLFVLGIIRGRL